MATCQGFAPAGKGEPGALWKPALPSPAVAEEDAEVRRLMIGDDEVEVAVVVHVGEGDVVGEMARGKG